MQTVIILNGLYAPTTRHLTLKDAQDYVDRNGQDETLAIDPNDPATIRTKSGEMVGVVEDRFTCTDTDIAGICYITDNLYEEHIIRTKKVSIPSKIVCGCKSDKASWIIAALDAYQPV